MAAVALFRAWPLIMARINERHRDRVAEETADWTRTHELQTMLVDEIKRLGERLKAVEIENEECRKNLADMRDELAIERAERMKFQRLLQANGEIRQAAQAIVSTEREAKKRDGK
jgi:hypothetical protein